MSVPVTTQVTFPNSILTGTALTPGGMVFVTTAGVITSTVAATNGQILIGSTGNNPALGTITGNTQVVVTNGTGTIGLSVDLTTGIPIGSTASSTGAFTTVKASGAVSVANTGSLAIYNTIDQVTNVEVLSQIWSGNVAMIVTNNFGTGLPRLLQLGTMVNSALNNNFAIRTQGSTNGQFNFSGVTNNTAGNIGILATLAAQTATSGVNVGFRLTTNYNQASGNASNTDWQVNRLTNTVGSGVQRLLSLQTTSVEVVGIDPTGNITMGVGGVGTQITSIVINGGNGSGGGGYFEVQRNGGPVSYIGAFAAVAGGTSADAIWYTPAGGQLMLWSNGAQSLKLDTSNNATFAGSVLSISSGGVGYTTGSGGAVTQLTNKATGVTINKINGAITLNNAALNSGAAVSFTVTNSTVAVTDTPCVAVATGQGGGPYETWVSAVGTGSFQITLRNNSGGTLSDALVLNFGILKTVNS